MSEPRPALVALDGVSRTYRRTQGLPVTALHPLSLSVAAGEFVCLAGPSGSGKTTLLNLMGLLDKPSGGQVTLAGQATDRLSRRAAARLRLRCLGLVFQEHNLLPVLSAYENVEYALLLQRVPAARRRERVLRALAQVGLDGLERRRPGELSGGQQQRVAVARAIVTAPPLLLADEPTASLDSASGREIVALLQRLNAEQRITCVFSSHDRRIIECAGRVVTLRDGRILADS